MNPWKPAILRIKPFGNEHDREISVESHNSSVRYNVNLHRYTCTCPDFLQRRRSRLVGDIGRSCKHLREAVLSLDSDAFGDELTRVIFKSPHGPYDRIWFIPGPDGEIIALGIRDEKDWVNLFVRRPGKGPYERYGYHRGDHRWAYGNQPSHCHWILSMLDIVPGGMGGSDGSGD